MPELKQIEAAIELGPSNTKLNEYGARYSDGHVETFIAVPDTDMAFSIHVKTDGYIAPGLSFFVFMDGEYHCNRNKLGLKLPGNGVSACEYEVDMRFRQKEEKQKDGTFVARAWSFAKLNTVAADKAPSLNPGFLRNVGTIEIVAMRCGPSTGEPTPQKSTPKARERDSEAAQPKPRLVLEVPILKSVRKTASEAATAIDDGGMLGGMSGLFDGACDDFGMDGANDERPVAADGRVTPRPPPGFYWDGRHGEFRPIELHTPGLPGAFPVAQPEPATSGHARARAFIADAMKEARYDQVDGPGDWPVEAYDFGYMAKPKTQDDLRGDRYLGMQGQDRSEYKQFYRERGDAVSDTPRPVYGTGVVEGFVCNNAAAANVINKAPAHTKYSARINVAADDQGRYANTPDGAALLAADLKSFKRELDQVQLDRPMLDLSEARREWRVMQAKLHAMAPGTANKRTPVHQARPTPKSEAASPFPALEAALEDLIQLRSKLRILGSSGFSFQTEPLLEELQRTEDALMDDPLFTNPLPADRLEALNATLAQLGQRKTTMSRYLKAMTSIKPSYDVNIIAKRLEEACDEVSRVMHEWRQLHGKTPSKIATGAGYVQRTPRQVNFQQGFDGPNSAKTNRQSPWAADGTGGNQQWEQVGQSAWKPAHAVATGSPWAKPKQPSTHHHFGGEELNNTNTWANGGAANAGNSGWGAAGAQEWNGNAGAGSRAGSQRNQQQWGNSNQQQHDQGGWGGADQQQNNEWNAWGNTSKPKSNAGWGNEGSKKNSNGGWGQQGPNKGGDWNTPGSQNAAQGWGASQKPSHKDNNNNGGWGNTGGGGGWANQSNKTQGQNGGWNAPKASAKESTSGERMPLDAKPKDLVKPYWKDWNKPYDPEQPDSAKKRKELRDPHIYPAAKLPVIPEGKVPNATHGVQAGRGAEYHHMCRRPVYIDTAEKPYAVFSFKYRTKDKLKKITGLDVKTVDEDVKKVQKQAFKDKLQQTPKHELIERIMKNSEGKGGYSPSQKAGSTGRPASNANGWDNTSKPKSAGGSGWGNPGGNNHSKSKNGGGGNNWNGGGWDGAGDAGNDTAKAETPTKPAAPTKPASEGFKFNYDAYKNVGQPTTPANKIPDVKDWERESNNSLFTDPFGVRWKGNKVIGYTGDATPSVKRDFPMAEQSGGRKGSGAAGGAAGGVAW